MEENKSYALYVRVSTEEQALCREGSIRSQLQRLEEYFQTKGSSPAYTVYQEEGRSAKDTNRPEFQRLVQDVELGKIKTIACTELSRISRSTIDFLQFIEFCNEHDVAFISLKEQFDSTTALGKVMMTICIALAQFEREQISERTSANMQARARRGLYNGGYIYGYRRNPERKGYLYPDEHEALVINLMYDKYLETGSYCQVVEWLNQNGYRTREYTSEKSKKFHPAGPWSKTTVLQILQNITYLGQRKIGDEVIDAVWDGIVEPEKWDKVQKLLKRNKDMKRNSNVPNKQHTYLLTGLVHCMHCGTVLENGSGTGNGGKCLYFYYRHPARTKKGDCPHPASFPAEELEKLVCEQIMRLIENDELLSIITDGVVDKAEQGIKEIKSRIEAIQNEIRQLESKAVALVEKSLEFDKAQVREFIAPRLEDISVSKQSLENSKTKFERELVELQEQTVGPEDIRYMISSLAGEFDDLNARQQQSILEVLLEKVELYPKKIVVFLYGYKKKRYDLLTEKFVPISDWLPREDSNLDVMIQSHASYQLDDRAVLIVGIIAKKFYLSMMFC